MPIEGDVEQSSRQKEGMSDLRTLLGETHYSPLLQFLRVKEGREGGRRSKFYVTESWVKCVPQYPGDKYLASISNVHLNSERKKLKPASFRNEGLSCRNTEAAAHNPRHIEHRGCISGGPAGRGPQLEEKVAKLQDPKSTEARSEAEVTPSGLEISGLLDESMEWSASTNQSRRQCH
ncbi:hypothetical protein B0H17DRAFT_1137511 [Mycena rosella]|uniref:Uncharacterized protein n=1 Tax=Mycena rosella TaxID=1033263 RepID=A0AAD7GDD9_MYCRO|nr:hypothetical protein B0H17DRAFT_1137511 [Mycena rosella]